MLSSAGTAHGQGPQAHPPVDFLAELVLVSVVGVEEKHRVEVAVADVAEQRRWNRTENFLPNIFFFTGFPLARTR